MVPVHEVLLIHGEDGSLERIYFMYYLTLRFKAPLQSWGVREDWYKTRRTASMPTKTALAGLIGRAMGVWSEEAERLEYISESIQDIRPVSDAGSVRRLTDDQTLYVGDYVDLGLAAGLPAAGGGIKRTNSGPTLSQQYTKDYLEDTAIEIDLGGSKDFLEKVKDALIHPVYPPYIGRYCCVPAECIVKDGIIREESEER